MFLMFFIFEILIKYCLCGSRCPSFGQLNYSCVNNDYCNSAAFLTCGDVSCGNDCPNGWINVGNSSCYYLSSTRDNYVNSLNYCKNMNGNLVAINNKGSLQNIKVILATYFNVSNNNSLKIWVSAKRLNYYEFKSWNKKILNYNDPVWCNGEPNFNNSNEYCVDFDLNLVNNLCLKDVECNNNRNHYICEIGISLCDRCACHCKPGYYFDGKICLQQKTIDQSCTYNNECIDDSNLECINGKCVCNNDTKWYKNEQKCLQCPIGWIYEDNNCYLINKQSLSCYDANEYCKNLTSLFLTLFYNKTFCNTGNLCKNSHLLSTQQQKSITTVTTQTTTTKTTTTKTNAAQGAGPLKTNAAQAVTANINAVEPFQSPEQCFNDQTSNVIIISPIICEAAKFYGCC